MAGLSERIPVRVSPETKEALVREAKRLDRSLMAVVRIAIRDYLAKVEK